jgi:hypothetical protein
MDALGAQRAGQAYGLTLAAVDWQRSGIGAVIPESTAEALVRAYRAAQQIEDDADDMPTAITWATSREPARTPSGCSRHGRKMARL